MNHIYNIIEKVISVALIILGIFLLYGGLNIFFQELDILVRSRGNSYSGISYYKFFKNYHLILLFGIFAVISGISLMRNKRFGWLTSIVILIGFPLSILLRNWYNPESDFHNPTNSTLIAITLTILVLLVGFFFICKTIPRKI